MLANRVQLPREDNNIPVIIYDFETKVPLRKLSSKEDLVRLQILKTKYALIEALYNKKRRRFQYQHFVEGKEPILYKKCIALFEGEDINEIVKPYLKKKLQPVQEEELYVLVEGDEVKFEGTLSKCKEIKTTSQKLYLKEKYDSGKRPRNVPTKR